MTYIDDLETLITEFEAEHGAVPRVTPADELYADYHGWTHERGETTESLRDFVRALARRDYMPCRLPDGTLGFIGLVRKDVLQQRGRA